MAIMKNFQNLWKTVVKGTFSYHLNWSFCSVIMCTGLWTLSLSFFSTSGLPHQPILCISMQKTWRRNCSMLPQQLGWVYFNLARVAISNREAVLLQTLTVVFYLCLHEQKQRTTVFSQLCKCTQTSWVLIAKSSEFRHTTFGFHQHTWTVLPFP